LTDTKTENIEDECRWKKTQDVLMPKKRTGSTDYTSKNAPDINRVEEAGSS
jgi:hypothetical protein